MSRGDVTVIKKKYLGFLVLISFVLMACGRDTSTVDTALLGTWELTDSYVNGEPLDEVLQDNPAFLDIDESFIGTNPEGNVVIHLEAYYEEEMLSLVDGDGNVQQTQYETLSMNEERNEILLAYEIEEEDIVFVLHEESTFEGEERKRRISTVRVVDMHPVEAQPLADTELEQELQQFGFELVQEMIQNIELTLHFDFVSEEAP